ncbi:MAG: MBL fold metallo-hydrolase [Candidatus Cloacimonadota bacterium]|nr:MBL fold metallo-hydrolase [Candidatus Cloacimonadota bacterium]
MKNLSFKIFLFIALVIFSSCTIKEFEAPEWDVELTVPLINETYYMKDIADSTEDYIIAVVNDTMEFSISQELDTTKVEDELKVDGKTETFDEEIGDELKIDDRTENFQIDVGDSLKIAGRNDSFSTKIGDELKIDEQSREFSRQLDKIDVEETGESHASVGVLEFARSAVPGIGEIHNQPLPPIYSFPPIDTNFTVFENDNLKYVIIDSGFAYIEFIDSTEIPLSSADSSHYMTVEIYGEEIIPENLILTHHIDHVIPGGATENIVLDLSGCKVYRYNFMRVLLTTDGTGATPIDVLEADKFIVILSVSEMTVSEASAKLPSEHIGHSDEISIQDETGELQIVSAVIDSCRGNIFIENNLPIDANVTILFEELYDNMHVPLQINLENISHNSTYNYPLNFANYSIGTGKQQPLDSLHFSFYVETAPTTDFVGINASQSVFTRIDFGKMKFNEVTGTLNNKTFNDNQAISIEDETGEISLQYAKIKSADNSYIFFHNDFPFDMSGTVTFQELKAPAPPGGPFTFSFLIPANSTYQEDLDLVNCTIESGKSIDSLQYSFNVTLSGTGSINYTDSVYAEFNLGEMYFDEVYGYINKSFTKEGSISAEDSIITLEQAKIKSGNVNVQISGLALDPSQSSIHLTLNNIFTPLGNPVEIDLDNFNSFTYDFTNHTIIPDDSLKINYVADVDIHQDLTVTSTDIVNADVTLQNLIFDWVKGTFESFTFEDSDASEVDETGEFGLFYAEIDSCDVQITIEALKDFPLEADVNIKFDEIFKDNGDTLKLTIHCPGDTLLSFAGYTIGDDPDSQTEIDSLHYSYDVVTLATDDTTTIRYEDKVKATITLGDMAFNKVVGVINNKRIDLDNIEEDFDISDMPDSLEDVLEFQNAEFLMTINNGINVGCEINARITGTNTNTSETSMILINHEYLAPNAVTTICKNVSDFLNILPDSIYADSMYVIMNGQGTICKTDSVFGSYTIRTPFEFIIENHNIKMDSLQHIEIDKDARDKIDNNFNKVHVCLTAENKFPFGATARLCFAADSIQVWENPELVIDSLTFEPAMIDTLHHVSGDKTISHLIINLSDAQGNFDVFTNEDAFLGIEFNIIGTDEEVVTIRGSDNMKIYGSIKVGVHIDESIWEEGE